MTREEAIKKVLEMKLSPGKDAELIIALHTLIPELSESEDERIRKSLIELVEQFMTDERKEKTLSYLKKQKERKLEERFEEAREKYQIEWSEEDRRIMDGIQLVLESWDRSHSSIAGLPSLIPSYISWLKSLRPFWKPSEEQMRHLHYALTPGSAFDLNILNELYEQLKKL